MLLPNGDRWDKKTHTNSKMTNAFGEIEFVGYGGNIGKVCDGLQFKLLLISSPLYKINFEAMDYIEMLYQILLHTSAACY